MQSQSFKYFGSDRLIKVVASKRILVEKKTKSLLACAKLLFFFTKFAKLKSTDSTVPVIAYGSDKKVLTPPSSVFCATLTSNSIPDKKEIIFDTGLSAFNLAI